MNTDKNIAADIDNDTDIAAPPELSLWGYVGALLNPLGSIAFMEHWFRSRQLGLLKAGLPFLIVGICGFAFLLWLKEAPRDQLIFKYETAVAKATADGKNDDALLLMQGLIQLRPGEFRYRYSRARLLLESGAIASGLEQIAEITVADRQGYAPARIWLVQQSISEKPLFPLTDEQRLEQALRAVKEDPRSSQAHLILASLYVRQSQLRLAESHLTRVVKDLPQLALELALIQQRLGRDKQTVAINLDLAAKHFSGELEKSPTDDVARIAWFRCMIAQGKVSEAEAILNEGLKVRESTILRSALSTVYSQHAATALNNQLPELNAAADQIIRALQLNPTNTQAINQVIWLSEHQFQFDPESLQPVIEAVRSQNVAEGPQLQIYPDSTPNLPAVNSLQRMIQLSGLLRAAGQPGEAAKCLEQLLPLDPAIRIPLVDLYRLAGETEKADELIAEVLSESTKKFEAEPLNQAVMINHVNALLAAHMPVQAMELLDAELRKSGGQLAGQPAEFRRSYADACLQVFENQKQSASIDERLVYLRNALMAGFRQPTAIHELAKIAFSEQTDSPQAEQLLNELAASGAQAVEVYRYMGICATEAGKFEMAIRYFERARSLRPRDAAILNNLAVAMIRHSDTNGESALVVTNDALALAPGQPEILVTRAEVFVAMKRWQEATQDLTLALSRKHSTPAIHRLLVHCYTELNEASLAAEHQRILEQLPPNR